MTDLNRQTGRQTDRQAITFIIPNVKRADVLTVLQLTNNGSMSDSTCFIDSMISRVKNGFKPVILENRQDVYTIS